MAIRLPLQTVLSSTNNDEVGAGSVGGGVPILFTIPQDTDNIVVKLTASTVGGGVSAQLQTTDDGGTTWFALGRTSVVSNAVGDNVQWLSISVTGTQAAAPSVVAVGSVVSIGTIGTAQPSTMAQYGDLSGLPVLSQQGRIVIQIVGNLTSSSILTQVKVNNQDATA